MNLQQTRLLIVALFWALSAPVRGDEVAKPNYMDAISQQLQNTYWSQWYRLHPSNPANASHENIRAELRAWQRLDDRFHLQPHHAIPPLGSEDRWPQENMPEETIFAQPTAEVWQVLPPHTEPIMSPISQ